jgi:uncharacterized protein
MLEKQMTATLPAGIRTVSRSADLPRRGWDDLTGPGDIYLTCRWLDIVEATAGVPMTYLWLESGGIPVAGLPTALATSDVPWALGRPDVVLRNSVAAALPGSAEFMRALGGDPAGRLMPTLLAGGRHVGGTRALYSAKATEADLEALVDGAEALARQSDAATVCFLYLDDTDRELGRILERRGYQAYVSGEYSVLHVPADGYPGYRAALPHKRRISVAAERGRIRQAGIQVSLESLRDADLPRLAELESELLAKYDIDLRPEYLLGLLRQVGDCFGDDAFAVVARAEGAIRGFALILRGNNAWIARQTGYDYSYQQRTRTPLYFEVLYYRLIEEAAAAGVRTIHYGLGSGQTKRSRGCSTTYQRCWTRFL